MGTAALGDIGSAEGHFGEQDITGLFCMPQVLADLIEACLGGKSAQPLADIILQDAALSAKIILAASKTSSKTLDPSEPVSSAIQQLGIPMVTGIALQAAKQVVRHRFTPQELSFQYGLWFASRVAGLTGRCLAPSVNYPYIEEAQLSGLLLNLGIHALFVRYGSDYIELDVNPWSSAIQCHLEEANYRTDHLQVADKLIGQWQLDSFLADTVRFLHADISQIEQSSILLKIARLAQQFCQSPELLTGETEMLGERLFGLRKSEIDYLFDWVNGLYPSFSTFLQDPEKLQADMSSARERLTELMFMLADQEAARARLANGESPEDLVRSARNLYLENSSATDAFFFLLDQKSKLMTGVLATGQPRLIGELKIPLEAEACLVSYALVNGIPSDSLQPAQPLTVTDHMLLRLCKSQAISCHPFRFEGHALGVVVLGIEGQKDLQSLQSLQVRMFGQVVSAALVRLSKEVQERFGEGSSLLRRVSHEVNNPLTIIGNYAEVLNHLLTDSDNQELTEAIKKEVRRIDDIINYYLNQQELPGFPGHSVDLNQLLEDTVETLTNAELKPRKIVVRFELKRDLDKLATNPVLIKQIMVNLIKNAAEAIGEGGVIQVSSRDSYFANSGRYAEIIVHDSGPGISPQMQEKLFRPVASSKGAGHAGVGLSIVKSMVDDLGGQISCHSSSQSGTSFHLLIPCREERSFDS